MKVNLREWIGKQTLEDGTRLTQAKLSDILGVRPATVSNMVRKSDENEGHSPNTKTVKKFNSFIEELTGTPSSCRMFWDQ